VKRHDALISNTAGHTNAGDVAVAATIAVAQLEPDLLLLGTFARDLCRSQGIKTVVSFLWANRKEMATVLAKDTECTFWSALKKVDGWKKDARQRLDTRKKQPVGLHPAFEVFNIDERSFFAAMSIATPTDLAKYEDLAQAGLEAQQQQERIEAKVYQKANVPVERFYNSTGHGEHH